MLEIGETTIRSGEGEIIIEPIEFEWFLPDHIVTSQTTVQRQTIDYYKDLYRRHEQVALPQFFDHEEFDIVEDGHHRLFAQMELQRDEGYVLTNYGFLPDDHLLLVQGIAMPRHIPGGLVYMGKYNSEYSRDLEKVKYHHLTEIQIEDPTQTITNKVALM